MRSEEFVDKLIKATKIPTLYIFGGWGVVLTEQAKQKIFNGYAYNKSQQRRKLIELAPNNTYGFDCSGLIKSILWGFDADINLPYGGAEYQSNGVPDYNSLQIKNACLGYTTIFTNVVSGEFLYMPGHCGIYIGNGKAVEASPEWEDGVQITNITDRNWSGHGYLPWVEYGYRVEQPDSDVLNAMHLNDLKDQVREVRRHLAELGAELYDLEELLYADNSV